MKTIAALALIAGLQGQTLMINSGGQATGGFLTDQGFSGGAAYGPASQADPGWKAQTGIYSTLRYGTAFSYDFAVPNGSCSVKLDLIENRPAVSTLGVTAASVGARVFTVTVNGVSTGPIDILVVAGAQTPYSPAPIIAPVTNGRLHLDFLATAGNASVSGIEATCTPAPDGLSCSSLTPAAGVVLVVTLKDGSCLPVSMLTAPGFMPTNIQAIWTRPDDSGNLNVQSVFTTLTASPQ